MEVHTPSGRFHLHIRFGRAELYCNHRRKTTAVPRQIIVYLLLAGKDGRFGIRIHSHSSSGSRSLPLLISDNLLSLTCHFGDLIQIQSNNGDSWVTKLEIERGKDLENLEARVFKYKLPKFSPYLYSGRWHHCNDGLWFESKHHGTPLIQIKPSHISRWEPSV